MCDETLACERLIIINYIYIVTQHLKESTHIIDILTFVTQLRFLPELNKSSKRSRADLQWLDKNNSRLLA